MTVYAPMLGTLWRMLEHHGFNGFGTATFEFVIGRGKTVRDVDKYGNHLLCNLHGYPRIKSFQPDFSHRDLREVEQGLAQAKAAAMRFPHWNQCIFEWGYFDRPIGWKKSPLIFWEVRRRN